LAKEKTQQKNATALASLPMYDWPELRNAHQHYWQLIREALRDHNLPAAAQLSSAGEGIAFWLSENLCLSQTCGLPYRTHLHGKVGLVGTPDYGLDDCPAGYYRSAVVVRADDQRGSLREFRQSTLAYNSLHSQSGFAALHNHIASIDEWPHQRLETGSHQRSVQAVATSKADIAAIDAVTWRLINRYDRSATKLRVMEFTEPTPGLPYICAKQYDEKLISKVVNSVVAILPPAIKEQLGICGLVKISASHYCAVETPAEVVSG